MKRKDPRWHAGRGIVVLVINYSAIAASFLVSNRNKYVSARNGEA